MGYERLFVKTITYALGAKQEVFRKATSGFWVQMSGRAVVMAITGPGISNR